MTDSKSPGSGQTPPNPSDPQWQPSDAEISPDVIFLLQYGVALPDLIRAMGDARRWRCSPARAIVLNGRLKEEEYFRHLSDYLTIPFAEYSASIEAQDGEPLDAQMIEDRSRMVLSRDIGPLADVFIAPEGGKLALVRELIREKPELLNRVRLVSRSSNRAALIDRGSAKRVNQAVKNLMQRFPDLSAHYVISKGQKIFAAVMLTLFLLVCYFSPLAGLVGLHILFSLFHMACVIFRLAAAVTMRTRDRRPQHEPAQVNAADAPTYSVLVAIYNEANQIPALIRGLNRLDWPRSKLEIKLVCEADDRATLNAIAQHIPGPPFEVIRVPPQEPRTKPKALNYALPICTGDLVVLYDAEDRPDPLQLREAWERFREEGDEVACLQAPLVIDNGHASWLSTLFTLEYAALFDGLLPTLARWKTVLPLGGTSNHFRRAVLDEVGGWDAHNVTEDADLGIRLARAGYRVSTLRRPTYEEAPVTYRVWVRQRSRWFKGWLQTWLVHQRRPVALFRELGLKNFLSFHLLITGMIVSAMTHLFFLASLAISVAMIFLVPDARVLLFWLFALDMTNVVLGYLSYGIIAWRALPVRGFIKYRFNVTGIPLYWLFISVGAWRALWQLVRDPFNWEKTPHGRSSRFRRMQPGTGRRKS